MRLNGEDLFDEQWYAFNGLTHSYANVLLDQAFNEVRHVDQGVLMGVLAYGHGDIGAPEQGYGYQAGYSSKSLY